MNKKFKICSKQKLILKLAGDGRHLWKDLSVYKLAFTTKNYRLHFFTKFLKTAIAIIKIKYSLIRFNTVWR